MRANELTDEQVAQYLRLYSCLFQTTVRCLERERNRTETIFVTEVRVKVFLRAYLAAFTRLKVSLIKTRTFIQT